MLGKMLCYDLEALSKILIPIHIGVLLVGAVLCVAGLGGYMTSENDYLLDRLNPNVSGTAIGMALVVIGVCILLLLCATITTFVIVLIHFYKNLFTDEGYLTLTLPLKAWQQLMSKVLAGLIWIVIDALIVMGCLTMFYITSGGFDPSYPSDMLPIWILKANLGGLAIADIDSDNPLFILVLWLNTFLQMTYTLMLAYTSLCAGAAIAAKHKVATGIAFFIGITAVCSMIYGLISVVIGINFSFIGGSSFSDLTLALSIVEIVNKFVQIAMIIGCWFLCVWILKRKVNLP